MNYRKPVISWNLVNIIFKVLPSCVELSTQKSSQKLHSFQIHCKILELANEPRQSKRTETERTYFVRPFFLRRGILPAAISRDVSFLRLFCIRMVNICWKMHHWSYWFDRHFTVHASGQTAIHSESAWLSSKTH